MRALPALLLVLLLGLAACADAPDSDLDTTDTLATPTPDPDTANTPAGVDGDLGVQEAVATLNPTVGSTVTGQVVFTALPRGVRVLAQVNGLPEGTHGFHVHETGDCSAPDASSAGGHFNPTGAEHGGPDAAVRHVGDLGNLEAGADSTAGYDRIDNVIELAGENSIVGKAIVVHSGADDFETQPTGDAGERLACGIIEATDAVDVDE